MVRNSACDRLALKLAKEAVDHSSHAEMLEKGEEEEVSEADRPENAPSDDVGGLSGRSKKDEKKSNDEKQEVKAPATKKAR